MLTTLRRPPVNVAASTSGPVEACTGTAVLFDQTQPIENPTKPSSTIYLHHQFPCTVTANVTTKS